MNNKEMSMLLKNDILNNAKKNMEDKFGLYSEMLSNPKLALEKYNEFDYSFIKTLDKENANEINKKIYLNAKSYLEEVLGLVGQFKLEDVKDKDKYPLSIVNFEYGFIDLDRKRVRIETKANDVFEEISRVENLIKYLEEQINIFSKENINNSYKYMCYKNNLDENAFQSKLKYKLNKTKCEWDYEYVIKDAKLRMRSLKNELEKLNLEKEKIEIQKPLLDKLQLLKEYGFEIFIAE